MVERGWRGVFPAVTTQFREDLSLDLAATARHWQALIESGISGLIVAGSLGENQTLGAEEKRTLVAEAVKCVAGRLPVLSGVAEMSTAAACRYVPRLRKARRERLYGHAGDGVSSRRRRGAASFSASQPGDEPALDALQQPRRLSGRCNAIDVR